jgi:transaldolase
MENPRSTSGKMAETAALGVELWNDSCALAELEDAVAHGFVGATSNPVIVAAAVTQDKARLLPVLDRLIADHPGDDEDQIAWRLIGVVVKEGAALLAPEHERSGGRRGLLCAQVSPKHWRSAARMVEHAGELFALAPNIAIKAPATDAGIAAMEEMAARGIPVNATVSFSVSQAVAVAEALKRGDARAEASKARKARHVVTLMIGRVDDHIKRVVDKEKVLIDPGHIAWAGIAVFKEAVRVFRARGFEATPLAAAYRHHLHWTELVGSGVVQTIPYGWWKQFERSTLPLAPRLEEPVDAHILSSLRQVKDFVRAHDEGAMQPTEFARYGASVHTLKQFLDGYEGLVRLVRERMLP